MTVGPALHAAALAHALGDVGGELLGTKRLAEHDLVDRLVHDLLESGHVDAGLLGVEVDEALEVGVEEGLGSVGGDADLLLDAGYPNPREAEACRGRRRLCVSALDRECRCSVGHPHQCR